MNLTSKQLTKVFLFVLLVWCLFFSKSIVEAVNSDPMTAIGPIKPPPGPDVINQKAGGASIAILYFVSNLVTLLTVVAGLWSTVNIILAGYTYITNNGKADSHDKVKNQILMSIIGLVLILTAYTFAGILGLALYGNAALFLSPVIAPI